LIVLINIRVSAETRAPIALVQLPLGLNLPVGAKFQVDEGKTSDLQIQTCEARGCYANLQISPDVLAALKSGKQLKVPFQNLAKETITIPMPLADFAAAYEKIKQGRFRQLREQRDGAVPHKVVIPRAGGESSTPRPIA
jgi:invasion protein IalB